MSRQELPAHVAEKVAAAEAREQRGRVGTCPPGRHSGTGPGGVCTTCGSFDPATVRIIADAKPPLALGRPHEPRYRSELERDFAALLNLQLHAGEILAWLHEGMTLNLGGGAKYKPDFNIVGKDRELTMAETKGFKREAAIVRIKVAAAKFPWLRFVLVTREDGAWKTVEVKP